MKATEKTMEKIVALCKNRGFVYSGSEIYGGLSTPKIVQAIQKILNLPPIK